MTQLRRKLILIGGGGHCRACIDVIESEDKYSIVGILDQPESVGNDVLGYKIVGIDDDIKKYVELGYYFLITVGHIGSSSATLRKKLYQKVLRHNGLFATIISPRAYVAKHSAIGNSTIVMHDALVNTNSTIGNNCIINSKALVEHDCVIMDGCHISTAAVLNGGVTVEERTFFGSNAVSKQGVSIKSNSFIKANSCYTGKLKSNKVAFLTTIYPISIEYVIDFFKSISTQTMKGFDVIILNDGYQNFEKIKQQFDHLNIIELPSAGTIAKNRQTLIHFAKVNGYDIAIFGDIDDVFSDNRIESSVIALETADIVVNDLTSIRDNKVVERGIYLNRLVSGELISFDFVKDKNIFGMSNTAVKLNIVQLEYLDFPEQLVAVDWFFFSLLLLNGAKAIFNSSSTTFYRQYETNTIGIGQFTRDKVKTILAVKVIHYENIKVFLPEFDALLKETLLLVELIKDEKELGKLISFNCRHIKHPLWWELRHFRNEK